MVCYKRIHRVEGGKKERERKKKEKEKRKKFHSICVALSLKHGDLYLEKS